MSGNSTLHLLDVPVCGKEGVVWNRLHEEREGICEALLQGPDKQADRMGQARLKALDDALDRLMSGAYGACSWCGSAIEPIALEIDPAWSKCLNCLVHGPRSMPLEGARTALEMKH